MLTPYTPSNLIPPSRIWIFHNYSLLPTPAHPPSPNPASPSIATIRDIKKALTLHHSKQTDRRSGGQLVIGQPCPTLTADLLPRFPGLCGRAWLAYITLSRNPLSIFNSKCNIYLFFVAPTPTAHDNIPRNFAGGHDTGETDSESSAAPPAHHLESSLSSLSTAIASGRVKKCTRYPPSNTKQANTNNHNRRKKAVKKPNRNEKHR